MSKKVFVLAPNEDWIADRQVKEYCDNNSERIVRLPSWADVIWLFADWCSDKIPYDVLQAKKVVTTVHHIVPEKFFGKQAEHDFKRRDAVTDVYHVPNYHTQELVKSLTDKPIVLIPYWANQGIWFKHSNKSQLRTDLSLPQDAFIVMSAQRDTEGSDLSSPKLEKGADLLADAFIKFRDMRPARPYHVVLGGWRRQYVLERISQAGITFSYFEYTTQRLLNTLYQTCDLYPVTARYEGGPQSFIECALLDVPMVSTSVGMAEMVLPPSAIHQDVTLATPAIPKIIQGTIMPEGFKAYNELFDSL